MRAAICRAIDRPLVIEETYLEPPRYREVKVRLAATAICHSDIHFIRGERAATPPFVVGHEGAGVVTEVGPGVSVLRPGDRVVLSLLRSCGSCYFCQTGMPFHCDGEFALATESRLRAADGQKLFDGGLGASAFAEYAIVDESQLVIIPDDLPFDRAALLGCGVITGLGAVVNTARVEPGASVVVIGVGGVGLNTIQGARIVGARTVIGVDPTASKREAAREFGATHVLDASALTVRDDVRGITEGRGADYVFVTVGDPEAVTQAFGLLRTAGTLVIVGLPGPGVTAPLPIREFAWAGQRVLGSCMGSTRFAVDIPWLIDLYRQGRLMLDELISAHFPLERINEAIQSVERGEARRHVIVFNGLGAL